MKFRPPVRDLSGSQLGEYRLVRKIAEGGMGEVYEGVQLKLDRRVAVKLLAEQLAREPEFLARFEREAKSAAALNHPNVLQVYDFGCANGQNYFVMELVDGLDLSLYVKEHGKLAVPVALEYFEQAVHALQFAARHAIIHRDVKPANLMLTGDGRVKVADLGLAKKLTDDSDVTMTGVGMGSPHFLAPEQADDAAHVDHRADIYSLGVTLLFLLTGRRPFDGASNFSVVLAHANKPLPTGIELGTPLPDEIERFIKRMTAKTPEARYQSYEELLADLQRVKAGQGPRQDWGQVLKNSKTVWITGAGIMALVALVFAAPWIGSDRKPTASESERQTIQPSPPGDRPERAEPRPPSQGDRPGFGDPREKGKGGAGKMDLGGGLRPPWPRRPPPDRYPLRDGPIPQMLAEADAYAAANKEEYVEIIHRYGQIEEKATGTPWQKEVERRFDQAQDRLQAASSAYIKQTEAKMEPLLQAGKYEEAYQLWRDFPLRIQTHETDQEVLQLLRRRLPPDFVPR
ncbi:MAG: serine/threonine protein kinase [Proteobacteria bacterium]|nr:serine/threonine protein kinase [Pseudomonadota bacterium]